MSESLSSTFSDLYSTNLWQLMLEDVKNKDWKYRKNVISGRGYNKFWRSFAAATIWGRLLIKGGYYYKIPKKLREIAPKMDIYGPFYLTFELI